MGTVGSAMTIAYGLEAIYQEFTDSVKKLGGKYGKGKMGTSVLHWIAGSRVKTQRDVLCDQFLQDVQNQLQLFDASLEDANEQEAREACEVLADVMSVSVDPNSNSTTDLMKRAMFGQLKPYLSRLSREKLEQVKLHLTSSYSKRQRLPVENDMLKAIDDLIAAG